MSTHITLTRILTQDQEERIQPLGKQMEEKRETGPSTKKTKTLTIRL